MRAGWIAGIWLVGAAANAAMPAAQETALVVKYCAVCHNDAHVNGGLSLQHFDAVHVDPGVAAMLLSKLTTGVPAATARRVLSDPETAALVAGKMKTGAMGAAGLPIPDRATQDALVSALAAQAEGADRWFVHEGNPSALTASILRETPANEAGDANSYRLTLTCGAGTEARMFVSWAPASPAKDVVLSAEADGDAPSTYKIDGSEARFIGTTGKSGTGVTVLDGMPLPERTLTVRGAFPGDTVVFPFGELPAQIRRQLSACFGGNRAGR